MAKKKTKLELTWIVKENRPKLEPRVLIEDPKKSFHAARGEHDKDIKAVRFERLLKFQPSGPTMETSAFALINKDQIISNVQPVFSRPFPTFPDLIFHGVLKAGRIPGINTGDILARPAPTYCSNWNGEGENRQWHGIPRRVPMSPGILVPDLSRLPTSTTGINRS